MKRARRSYVEGAGRWMLMEAVDAGTDSAYDQEERLRAAFPGLGDGEVDVALKAYRKARGLLMDRMMKHMKTTQPEQ